MLDGKVFVDRTDLNWHPIRKNEDQESLIFRDYVYDKDRFDQSRICKKSSSTVFFAMVQRNQVYREKPAVFKKRVNSC